MKDYCKQIFGKSLDELKYNDIDQFFESEQDETTILEFKSGQIDQQEFNKVLREKIIRGITSFLNSEGGVLIWGTPQEQKITKGNKKVRVAKGKLAPNKIYLDKDQIVNKIVGNISYLPTGLRVNILENDNNYIYIFEVQESSLKPHQYNYEYPIRLDGHTQAAPHYIIESMFKQIKSPELEGYLSIERVDSHMTTVTHIITMQLFNFSPFINDTNVFYHVTTNVGVFTKTGYPYISGNTGSTLHYGTPFKKTFSIVYTTNEMNKTNNKLELTLVFGGQISSAKNCKYEFDLSDLSNGIFEWKKHIVSISENISFLELHEIKGLKKSDIIKATLHR